MTNRSQLGRANIPRPANAAVVRRAPVAASRFRELYRRVGAEYRWSDRDAWSDDAVERRFASGTVGLWELEVGGALAGFYELEAHEDGSVEIVLFGLLPEFGGRGLGKWMLVDACDRAWAMGASRVWLHTCTLDAPAAMPNYLARGFRPYRTERYEIAE